jgi:hypothetical protein
LFSVFPEHFKVNKVLTYFRKVIKRELLPKTNGSTMISIVYGSPAAGSGNKWAATIGGLGR